MEYINASVSKMFSLLSSLLQLSRTGTAKITMEQINMNRLIDDVEHTLEFQLKEAKIAFSVAKLPRCMGDESQINQAFSNLIDNAIKYVDHDGSGKISISGETHGGRAVYCVEDSGVGISSDQTEKIFEIFFQLDPASSSGEGLGLSIVKKIVERNNGRIWVESEPGKGSKFFLSFQAITFEE